MNSAGEDPALAAADADALPAVARASSPWGMRAGVAAIALLGAGTFYDLNSARTAPDTQPLATANGAPSTSASLPPPPVLAPVVARVAAPLVTAAPVAAPVPVAPVITTVAAPPAPRSVTPALLVDLTSGEKPPLTAAEAAAKAGGGSQTVGDKLNSNEAFAARVNRTAPDTVGTDKMSSTDLVVPQGTIIVAVLETAINSDLPGMVRAVVSRDVRGFDATKVLIPRGSRLIGQYSNGVALGQSRAFVIWSRLLRNDGVSVQLGSAATDPLGTAGLSGKVNSHFLRRFGAAALLSVITSGLDLLSNSSGNRGTNVLVGSSTQANQLASIALQREIDIPPTIRIPQGTPVRVFVARDLDFGATKPAQP